jgi:hypothetical protein
VVYGYGKMVVVCHRVTGAGTVFAAAMMRFFYKRERARN